MLSRDQGIYVGIITQTTDSFLGGWYLQSKYVYIHFTCKAEEQNQSFSYMHASNLASMLSIGEDFNINGARESLTYVDLLASVNTGDELNRCAGIPWQNHLIEMFVLFVIYVCMFYSPLEHIIPYP